MTKTGRSPKFAKILWPNQTVKQDANEKKSQRCPKPRSESKTSPKSLSSIFGEVDPKTVLVRGQSTELELGNAVMGATIASGANAMWTTTWPP